MVAVKAHEADRALAALDASIRLVLFYGPDHGLVAERAAALAARSVSDPGDPFQMVRLDGGDVAGDPLRLADEANTIGLFGGKRVIRVSATSRPLTAALEPVLASPPQDSLIILEGGDLQKSNPLRVQVERSRSGLAVPCYADQGRALEALVDPILREHGLAIDRDARALLLSRLGADRQLSRREIEKLALFAYGQGTVTTADVEAIVGDASAKDAADIADGLFTGATGRIDQALTRLGSAGEDAGSILGYVIRHALMLLAARQLADAGRSIADAAQAVRGVTFTRRADVEASLKRWSTPQLVKAVALLQGALLQGRRNPQLANEIALRVLWNLALGGTRG